MPPWPWPGAALRPGPPDDPQPSGGGGRGCWREPASMSSALRTLDAVDAALAALVAAHRGRGRPLVLPRRAGRGLRGPARRPTGGAVPPARRLEPEGGAGPAVAADPLQAREDRHDHPGGQQLEEDGADVASPAVLRPRPGRGPNYSSVAPPVPATASGVRAAVMSFQSGIDGSPAYSSSSPSFSLLALAALAGLASGPLGGRVAEDVADCPAGADVPAVAVGAASPPVAGAEPPPAVVSFTGAVVAVVPPDPGFVPDPVPGLLWRAAAAAGRAAWPRP